jgi:3-hydroxyacyl-[acyl-carrier-protein] dehydratase
VTSDKKQKTAAVESRHSSPVTGHFLSLPHRPPFVFVQELLACTPGVFAECATSFHRDDPMFAGHFPKNPLVPGVILTEALAQTAGIAAASAYSENARPLFLLSAIRAMKFLRAVRPEEGIVLRARKLGEIGELLQFEVEALVDGQQVASGELVLSKAARARPS